MSGGDWEPPAWVDGRLLAGDAPAVPALDVGLRSGLGVFETMRAREERIPALAAHLARLTAGARRLGFELDPAGAVEGIAALLALPRPTSRRDVVVRVTATAGTLRPGGPVGSIGDPGDGGPGHLLVTLHAAPQATEPKDRRSPHFAYSSPDPTPRDLTLR